MKVYKHLIRVVFEIISADERPNIAIIMQNNIDNMILSWCKENSCLSSEAQASAISEEKEL
jgi:hypothetical protein